MAKNIKIKFIIVAILTAIFSILVSYDIYKTSKEVTVDYVSEYVFNSQEVIDSLSKTDNTLYLYYKENGITLNVDDNVLSSTSIYSALNVDLFSMFADYVSNVYDIDVTITDSSSTANLYLDTILSKESHITYSSTPSLSDTIQIYSSEVLPQNMYSLINSDYELEIITTENVWSYLNHQFPNHKLTLVDINGDTKSDENDLVSAELLYDYFINEDYSEYTFFAATSNYHFSYMTTYGSITENLTYETLLLDNQFAFFGSQEQETVDLFIKLFNVEMMSEFFNTVDRKIYYKIVDGMIHNYDEYGSTSFIDWLTDLDTLYIGLYEGDYPYVYEINGEIEGYFVEIYKVYESILEYYDINIEYVLYSDDDFDPDLYDNFLYTNYFKSTGERENYYYSTYYEDNTYRIVSKNDDKVYNELYEIDGKIAFPSYLSDYQHLLDVVPKDNIVYCDTIEECFDLLDKGEVDYYLVETTVIRNKNLLDAIYKVNYVFTDFTIRGYTSVPDYVENGEYIIELINILYPAADRKTLIQEVELTLENYINSYKSANDIDSNLLLYTSLYFITVLVIYITIILDYKKQNSNSRTQIDNLVNASNICLFGGILTSNGTKTDDSNYLDNLNLYMSINMINALEIENFSLDKALNRNYIDESDFFNNIIGYTTNNQTNFTRLNNNISPIDFFKKLTELKEVTIRHRLPKSNDERYFKYSFTSTDTKQGLMSDAIVNDTSHIYKRSKFFKQLAFKDQLTGASNQSRLEDDYKTRDFNYFITLNISNFRHFNTSYSRKYADDVLKNFTSQIQSILPKDTFIYRIIADDFIIMTNLETEMEVEDLINSIKRQCSNLKMNEKSFVNVSTYVSISKYDKSKYDGFSEFSNEYTLKLQISKNNKFGLYISDDDLSLHDFERTLQSEIFKLKTFKNFEIYLQPKINPKNGNCIGAETLIRWKHPRYGEISPSTFLDKFENLGKIDSLDKFVIKETCKAYNNLKESNLITEDFVISFNLSTQTILETNFVFMIINTLDNYKIDYSKVEVEILESFDIKNHPHIVDSFTRLFNKGIKIAIDDYGSGYSNVYTMTSLPFTTLKFDKSIIDNIEEDSEKAQIFKNLTHMHNTLGHFILVEGVESQEQIEIIKTMDILAVQGYYYSRPLPYDKFISYLKDSH